MTSSPTRPPPEAVTILGLGLIGGSLARDLSELGVEVKGFDPDATVLRTALELGVLSGIANPEGSPLEGLIVLATPVDISIRTLRAIRPRLAPGAIVTDVGSTKQSIGQAAESLGLADRFIGGHPLAGDHRSGWRASRTGLFRDAVVYLCGDENGAPFSAVADLWTSVGARVRSIEPVEHDRTMALISHLPQVVSSALADLLAEHRIRPGALGPGGRDMTRLAGSSAAMWTAIAASNRDNLSLAIAELTERLNYVREALERGDEEALGRFFEGASRWLA